MTDDTKRLRNTTEDDVIAAIEGSYIEDVLDVLLDFFRRKLNEIAGEAET